jgi:transposase-like protein
LRTSPAQVRLSGFLAHLKGRGLRGVELIVSDACLGLPI